MAEDEMTATKRGRSSSEIIKQFNSLNAKILAILLVGCLLGYHGALKFINGTDRCQGLLTKGRYQGNNFWQPYGCMIHSLSRIDAENCLKKTRFMTGEETHWAFVGDSRIRQVYFEILKLLDPDAEPNDVANDGNGNSLDVLLIDEPYRVSAILSKKETKKVYGTAPIRNRMSSLIYNNSQLSFRMLFFWRPMLNQTTIDLIHQLVQSKSVPNLVIAGSGSWIIKGSNGSKSILENYSRNLRKVAEAAINWPNKKSKLLWKLQDRVDSSKLDDPRKGLTNELIDEYNEKALEAFQDSRF